MRPLLLLVLFLAIPTSLMAEEDAAPAASFPASWQGDWTGTAAMIRGGETKTRFAMELHVEPLEGKDGWTCRSSTGRGRSGRSGRTSCS